MNECKVFLGYEDIINLAHPEPPQPRMEMAARAAQFMPFQALTGYAEKTRAAAKIINEQYNKY